jgi:hypothetical protein
LNDPPIYIRPIFPPSAGAKRKNIQIQAITADRKWHHGRPIATDFLQKIFAESVTSQGDKGLMD